LKTRDILAISGLSGVGPVAVHRMLESSAADLADLRTLPPRIANSLANASERNAAFEYADKQLDWAELHGVTIISRADRLYPPLLAKHADAPAILFVKGNLEALTLPSVGIIGTREPTAHGVIATKRMTAAFVQEGFAIVSGLALGCDAIAHEECSALNAPGIAVLAHGLQTIAPKRNAKLADAILAAGGLLVSEFPFGVEPQPRLFVQRDKTQALLSQAIVMMQSDLKGGSLHASRAALKYGRVLIVPHPTSLDITNNEPKIQANLVLSDSPSEQKLELLGCSREDLARLMIVRGRDDYPDMFGRMRSSIEPSQTRLL
jgi:DNA processing protein